MLNLCLNDWEQLFLLRKWVTKLTFYGFEDVWSDFLFLSNQLTNTKQKLTGMRKMEVFW